MNQKEIDFLNFENELLNSRKKLNDLIYAYSNENPALVNKDLYMEKIHHLEAELKYMEEQLWKMKQGFNAGVQIQPAARQMENLQIPAMQRGTVQIPSMQTETMQMPSAVPADTVHENAAQHSVNTYAQAKDYEKLFGKNFMGVFASVLIFISLIIFATLILPYLSNTIKMIGMYILSFAILSAGLIFYKKKPENKFYIALIGCGAGSLYITLLLSDLYFKVIGDITLYIFILIWAVLVKYLTKYKNLVFMIIGQSGIFIATILGTALCVDEKDAAKFFVLTVFYMISACVFSNLSRAYLRFLLPSSAQPSGLQFFYEDNLCGHICKSLNVTVLMFGFSLMPSSPLKIMSTALLMLYLLLEFCIAYKETCRSGIAFEILTIVNSILMVCLFNVTEILNEDYSYILMYIISVVVLFYVNRKKTKYTIVSEICCFIMIYLGSYFNPFIRNHLYAYLTVIPFMIYGKLKNRKLYLYTSLVYTAIFLLVIMSLPLNYHLRIDFLKIESLIMIFVVYAVFLYVCRNLELPAFKIIGYPAICIIVIIGVDASALYLIHKFLTGTEFYRVHATLISFFMICSIHLVLNKLEYLGKERPIESMMYFVTAVLMVMGCSYMYSDVWKLPTIMITLLLFLANSKKLLLEHKYVGYYIAFKYTALMFCILTSYHIVDYVISICLLLFAIASIIAGFYKDTISFRLYGLVLSMISIIKLIMIDIHYDSTIENAVSFFVSGVLCFIISFIYHKIDTSFRKNSTN